MTWRFRILIVFVFACGVILLGRFFSVQILNYDYYRALAQDQHQISQILNPKRGEIYLSDLSAGEGEEQYVPLAINKDFFQVYLVPKNTKEEEKEEIAEKLSVLLELEKNAILDKLDKKDDPYEPLKHKVSKEIALQIGEMNFQGVELSDEVWRYYPYQNLASQLVGFVGTSERGQLGQYGLEGYYEEKLRGKDGLLAGEKDIAGYRIPFLSQSFEPAQNGATLILTIDQNIQFKIEKELKQAISDWQAQSGTIIVMEPKTGAILGMASWPDFNPNEYNKVENVDLFSNPAIQSVYEPGSVFKPITMAIGIETGKVTPEMTYEDKGSLKIGGTTIGNVDHKSYGLQTMTQVLEKSLNTGAMFVGQRVGTDLFEEFVRKFDFDKPEGIDLAGEVAGDIFNLFSGREVNFATASFGQGISMTPLSLISAIAAIANSGKIMRPFVVSKIIDYNGNETETVPQVIKEPILAETAETLAKMMASVVENGFSKKAQIEGYSIAGKTGTAQMPDLEKGGYSEEDTIHTFVGFAPAFDSRFIILVKLDRPQGTRFANTSTIDTFRRIAEYLLNYLRIPPQ